MTMTLEQEAAALDNPRQILERSARRVARLLDANLTTIRTYLSAHRRGTSSAKMNEAHATKKGFPSTAAYTYYAQLTREYKESLREWKVEGVRTNADTILCISQDRHPNPEEYAQLRELIEALDTKEQETIWLRNYEMLGWREIGEVMLMSRTYAQKIYNRAIRKMREKVK